MRSEDDLGVAAGTPAQELFVSYSSLDEELAFRFVSSLEEAGVRCWVAGRDVMLRVRWDDEIAQALDRCGAHVLILTESSAASDEVKAEMSYITKRGHTPIVVRADGVLLPYDLERILGATQEITLDPDALDHAAAAIARELYRSWPGGRSSSSAPAEPGLSPTRSTAPASTGDFQLTHVTTFDRTGPLTTVGDTVYQLESEPAGLALTPLDGSAPVIRCGLAFRAEHLLLSADGSLILATGTGRAAALCLTTGPRLSLLSKAELSWPDGVVPLSVAGAGGVVLGRARHNEVGGSFEAAWGRAGSVRWRPSSDASTLTSSVLLAGRAMGTGSNGLVCEPGTERFLPEASMAGVVEVAAATDDGVVLLALRHGDGLVELVRDGVVIAGWRGLSDGRLITGVEVLPTAAGIEAPFAVALHGDEGAEVWASPTTHGPGPGERMSDAQA